MTEQTCGGCCYFVLTKVAVNGDESTKVADCRCMPPQHTTPTAFWAAYPKVSDKTPCCGQYIDAAKLRDMGNTCSVAASMGVEVKP